MPLRAATAFLAPAAFRAYLGSDSGRLPSKNLLLFAEYPCSADLNGYGRYRQTAR